MKDVNAVSLEFNLIRDFIYPSGSIYVPGVINILEGIYASVKWFKKNEVTRICINDEHSIEQRTGSSMFPEHAVIGTSGIKPIPEISGYRITITKQGVSAYSNPAFNITLNKLHPDHIYVIGVHADYAIFETLRKLMDTHIKIILIENAIHGYSATQTIDAYEYMLLRGATFITTEMLNDKIY